MKQRSPALGAVVVFGYLLLYVPIVSVVVYSFNEARLASSFACCSLRWYVKLLTDQQLVDVVKALHAAGLIKAEVKSH